mmetsp:Transcript_121961/g.235304  ORF Transcript_121961/g.235304 Transcript_121961/m.235304 type:complete len:96 (-) Transcript_121961:12-299(-)
MVRCTISSLTVRPGMRFTRRPQVIKLAKKTKMPQMKLKQHRRTKQTQLQIDIGRPTDTDVLSFTLVSLSARCGSWLLAMEALQQFHSQLEPNMTS